MWKAKTRDQPQMCQRCSQKSVIESLVEGVNKINIAVLKIRAQERSSLKKPPKTKPKEEKLSDVIKRADVVFSKWVRKKVDNYDRTFACISCGRWYSNKEMDAGHFITRKRSSVRFHPDNCWPQCKECNRMKDGNEKKYEKNLIKLIGQERVDQLKQLANQTHKWTRQELLDLIEKYK